MTLLFPLQIVEQLEALRQHVNRKSAAEAAGDGDHDDNEIDDNAKEATGNPSSKTNRQQPGDRTSAAQPGDANPKNIDTNPMQRKLNTRKSSNTPEERNQNKKGAGTNQNVNDGDDDDNGDTDDNTGSPRSASTETGGERDGGVTVWKGMHLRHYVRPQERYRAATDPCLPKRRRGRGPKEAQGAASGKEEPLFPSPYRRKVLDELVQHNHRMTKDDDAGVVSAELRARIDRFFISIEPYCPKPQFVLES